MNIKKYSLKTMCVALACTTVLNSMLATYATNTTVYETPMNDSAENNSINTLANDSAGTDTSDSGWATEENSFEDIKVTYQQSSSYAVTIQKMIAWIQRSRQHIPLRCQEILMPTNVYM